MEWVSHGKESISKIKKEVDAMQSRKSEVDLGQNHLENWIISRTWLSKQIPNKKSPKPLFFDYKTWISLSYQRHSFIPTCIYLFIYLTTIYWDSLLSHTLCLGASLAGEADT